MFWCLLFSDTSFEQQDSQSTLTTLSFFSSEDKVNYKFKQRGNKPVGESSDKLCTGPSLLSLPALPSGKDVFKHVDEIMKVSISEYIIYSEA